jgi:ligand-binding sensor domain-containing protein
MNYPRLVTIVLLVGLCHSLNAQEYSYTHYDIGDGLAGSTVYCITQDKDGFIWTGTETGVSRFDGTHFRTYTVSDGLPDIEILQMFGDSKDRVWMAPFGNSVCYYYKGHIHNQNNDSLLRRIHIKENIEDFAEDEAGDIIILERTALYWVGANGGVREIDSIGGHPIVNALGVCRSASGQIQVETDGRIYAFPSGEPVYSFPIESNAVSGYIRMGPASIMWRTGAVTNIHSFLTGKTITLPFEELHYKHFGFWSVGDSLYYFNEITGSREFNTRTGKTRVYLPGRPVSKIFRDASGNTWFTTAGQGIYRLNSDEFRTIKMKVPNYGQSSVHCITKLDSVLLIGDNYSTLFTCSLPGMVIRRQATIAGGPAKNRILYLQPLNRNTFFLGSDSYLDLCSLEAPSRTFYYPTGIKAAVRKNEREFLLASYWGVGVFNLPLRRITDTLWRGRTTALYYNADTLYIGTLKGLYVNVPGNAPRFLGKEFPFLQKRISALAASADGTLWIGSYDGGVVGWREGRIVAAIDRKTGLTSDICRTLLVQNNALWIGTDKGLNKVGLDRIGLPVTRYTSNDGLGSDMINCLYADSSTIYVGTPAGLSYFDQTKVAVSEGCRLHLLSVLNAGKDRIEDTSQLTIPYRDKYVRFEYAGISYRSVGDIIYHYRMLGLDTGWRATKESYLDYPILPSGKYVFQLQAFNKFGVASGLLSMPLEVATPFWQAVWFQSLLLGGFLALVWLFVTFRITRIRRRQEETQRLNQRLVELENTALQSQMNPHFIFNCLNSIQQYIFDHEAITANKYLTGFARLIRATLNNSSRTFIPLSDEIDYLSTYLSLEKLRFKDKMEYSIRADPSLDKEAIAIPPMLIQPFVENSMRHGLRHKAEGKGNILIRFEVSGHQLVVTVEDNGIGRKKAAGYKTREHIEYQSKGMSLTADRIRVMNTKYDGGIRVDVTDLEDDRGRATGTRVTLNFPLFKGPGMGMG